MSFVWILGTLTLLAVMSKFANCQNDQKTMKCDANVYRLQGTGIESSLTLTLALLKDSTRNSDGPETCPIQIIAPETHLLYIRFAETPNFDAASRENLNADSSCTLSVFVPEKYLQPVWTGDACTMDADNKFGLLPNMIMFLWRPPALKEHIRHKELLITALGKKEFCRSKNQHTCVHVGWTPLVCVAEELLCDGVVHCPPGAIIGDENPQFCRDKHILSASNWEKIATEFLRKFTAKTKGRSLLPSMQDAESAWDGPKTTEQPLDSSSPNSFDSISAALAHYGPWGYLMLGMLLCGTVLMFCGLWECCCRKPKPYTDTPANATPTSVLVVATPTQETPPRYEDLDQPPSYTQLFPDLKNSQEAQASTRPATNCQSGISIA